MKDISDTSGDRMVEVKSKYEKAELPSKKDALDMASTRDIWAEHARSHDKPGTAYEFELMALLLRFYADNTYDDNEDPRQTTG